MPSLDKKSRQFCFIYVPFSSLMGFGLQNSQTLVLYLEYAFFFLLHPEEIAVSCVFAIRHKLRCHCSSCVGEELRVENHRKKNISVKIMLCDSVCFTENYNKGPHMVILLCIKQCS